jgi:predicted lipoprotein with Yx(FWY)xxD motif
MMNSINTKTPVKLFGLLLFTTLILAACQPVVVPVTGEMPEAAPGDINPMEEVAEMGIRIEVATHPNLGRILVDGNGMTLYMFTMDEPDKSNCAGDCLAAWPPLVDDGNVTVGEGVDASLLGSAALPDGSMIVTYNKMPLYFWVGDTKAGDATGQDVNKVWYVVSPEGEPIGTTMSEKASSEVIIQVANHPEFGDILVDGNGMTLYLFTQDGPNQSNCAGACLESWPPLIDDGNVEAGEELDASLLGKTELPDDSMIVTYNKIPLYYWVGDVNPGDTKGHGVNNVWYVVSPEVEDKEKEEKSEYKY